MQHLIIPFNPQISSSSLHVLKILHFRDFFFFQPVKNANQLAYLVAETWPMQFGQYSRRRIHTSQCRWKHVYETVDSLRALGQLSGTPSCSILPAIVWRACRPRVNKTFTDSGWLSGLVVLSRVFEWTLVWCSFFCHSCHSFVSVLSVFFFVIWGF